MRFTRVRLQRAATPRFGSRSAPLRPSTPQQELVVEAGRAAAAVNDGTDTLKEAGGKEEAPRAAWKAPPAPRPA